MRTNRPTKAAVPRHRKPGPARIGGTETIGKRAAEAPVDESAGDAEEH